MFGYIFVIFSYILNIQLYIFFIFSLYSVFGYIFDLTDAVKLERKNLRS